jgi:hypothetical protein
MHCALPPPLRGRVGEKGPLGEQELSNFIIAVIPTPVPSPQRGGERCGTVRFRSRGLLP